MHCGTSQHGAVVICHVQLCPKPRIKQMLLLLILTDASQGSKCLRKACVGRVLACNYSARCRPIVR